MYLGVRNIGVTGLSDGTWSSGERPPQNEANGFTEKRGAYHGAVALPLDDVGT